MCGTNREQAMQWLTTLEALTFPENRLVPKALEP